MDHKAVVEIQGLSKQFVEIRAVNNLSMTVYESDVYGFLGPNGSGKSTTIRMLLTLVRPDTGNIRIFGDALRKYRISILKRVGSFVEKPDFYEYLSAKKNLELLSKYSGFTPDFKKIGEVLELVGLQKRAGSKVKTFSKGMKQRLGIAQALLHDPFLLILDEPASGLDPGGMRDIRNLIRFLHTEKKITIILSSHNLQEIEQVANRMIIINHGEKVVEGEVEHLLEAHKYYTAFEVDDISLAENYIDKMKIKGLETRAGEKYLRVFCHRRDIPAINRELVQHGIAVNGIKTEQTLEDYFLTLT